MIRTLFCILLLLPGLAYSQNALHCGTGLLHEETLKRNPDAEMIWMSQERAWSFASEASAPRGAVRRIPVVVHVIQQTDVVDITDARILSQIDVLNEDFRKLSGTPGFGAGVDTQIEFCMASIDPNGCPTTGINRVVNPTLAWHDMDDEALMKALIQWDPHRYLNVWVPRVITGGILGYARFPYTLNSNPAVDGVVINGNFIGRGNGIVPSSYDQGRTATHEVGHWLGLFHTFDGGCAGMSPGDCSSAGDRVCDTPPTSNSNFGCPSPQNTCNESPVDEPDQTRNYMDYTNDTCMDMYTQGQTDRMFYFLDSIRTLIWSAGNLSFTGCDGTLSAGCVPVSDFKAIPAYACTGNTLQFTDISTNQPTSWNWSFPGGNPSSSTLQNPSINYAAAGLHDVTLIATNSLGSDTILKTSYVQITDPLPVLIESFETNDFLQNGWYIRNPDGLGAWQVSSQAQYDGVQSIRFDNFTDSTAGGIDDLVTSPITFQMPDPALSIDFRVAYRRFSAFRPDTLQVLVSTDCGLNWSKVWEKTGAALATVAGIYPAQPFVPASTEWRAESIDVTPYHNLSDVRFAFRNISRGGQVIWLDLVELVNPLGQSNESNAFAHAELVPNPTAGNSSLRISGIWLGDARLEILSPEGRLIRRETLCKTTAISEWQLEAESLLPGLYFVKLETKGQSRLFKWIIIE